MAARPEFDAGRPDSNPGSAVIEFNFYQKHVHQPIGVYLDAVNSIMTDVSLCSKLEDALSRGQFAWEFYVNAWMLFAEAATVHPDRTFSVLKAGIDRLTTTPPNPGQPNLINGALVIRITCAAADAGRHVLSIVLEDKDSKINPVLNVPEMPFAVPETGGVHNAVINLSGLPVPDRGQYKFRTLVDNVEVARWPLEVL